MTGHLSKDKCVHEYVPIGEPQDGARICLKCGEPEARTSNQKLSCPFCGGRDVRAHYRLAEWVIECHDCSCELTGFASSQDAWKAWNGRWKPTPDETKSVQWSPQLGEYVRVPRFANSKRSLGWKIVSISLEPDGSFWFDLQADWQAAYRCRLDEIEQVRDLKAKAPETPAPANLIVSAEEAKQPMAFRHWSKDEAIPYCGCQCDTCVAARRALSRGART